MSNVIKWDIEDYQVDDEENPITHLNIFRIPSYIPLDRFNLYEPHATVYVDELHYEDEYAVPGEKYRYFITPKNTYAYNDTEWPDFTGHPGVAPVDDTGITPIDSANSFGYQSGISVVIPKMDNKSEAIAITPELSVSTFNYYSVIDENLSGGNNE